MEVSVVRCVLSCRWVIFKRITDENYARFGDGIFEIKMEEEYKNEFMVPKEFKELQI